MKVGFLTTVNTNIGDDFIRTGIENVIRSIDVKEVVEFTYVNKHHPETVLTGNSPLRYLQKLPAFRGKRRLENLYYKYLHQYFNVYAQQDLVIQSGAPVLWPDCFISEWNYPVWYQTIGKLKGKLPVINLAAGSCYPWERQGDFLNEREKDYAADIGSFCTITTTRDRLAHELFSKAGIENHLIPCSAFLVNPAFENKEEGEYILINYMSGGGHFDWEQKVDAAAWEATMKEVIERLKQKHEVRFICHNGAEAELATKLYPGLKVHIPANVQEYMQCISKAKAGLNNRMHASVAMASFGVPAVSVCTDTRLLMLDLIGLPNYYVKDVNASQLIDSMNTIIDNRTVYKQNLFRLKENTFARYKELLKPFIR
jgi:hypothetical protein